jgi:hypothetical protein
MPRSRRRRGPTRPVPPVPEADAPQETTIPVSPMMRSSGVLRLLEGEGLHPRSLCPTRPSRAVSQAWAAHPSTAGTAAGAHVPSTPALCAGRAPLFAATEHRLHFFERGEIFLQPVDMLLHLDDGRPEFLRRAQCPT